MANLQNQNLLDWLESNIKQTSWELENEKIQLNYFLTDDWKNEFALSVTQHQRDYFISNGNDKIATLQFRLDFLMQNQFNFLNINK
jgi:hypothetical protein